MKFRQYMTATAIFVCLAVFLCACGKGADSVSTTEPTVTEAFGEAEVFTVPDADAQTSEPAGKQADTQAILRRIQTARAVYGMFSETRPQLDKEDSIEAEEGLFAYRVTDPNLDTMEKLTGYVSGYFSEEITQQLLNIGIFIDYDGKLYAVDRGMPAQEAGELHVEVTEKTDSAEHYRLTVGDNAERTYDLVYEKQADGKWVFTRFACY